MASLRLERCVRLAPQDQDYGGFFVAVFHKKGEHAPMAGALPDDEPEVCVVEGSAVLPEALSTNAPVESPPVLAADADAADVVVAADAADAPPIASSWRRREADPWAASGSAREGDECEDADRVRECAAHEGVLHAHGGATVEAAARAAARAIYTPLFVPSAVLLGEVMRAYGLGHTFPCHRLVVRSPTARSLLLLAPECLALLRADAAGVLRVVQTGARLFERDEAKGCSCSHRVCQDGIDLVEPYMKEQRVPCSARALCRLLECVPTNAKGTNNGVDAPAVPAAAPVSAPSPSAAAVPPNTAPTVGRHLSVVQMCADADLLPLFTALKAGCRAGCVVLVCTPPGQPPVSVAALLAPSGSLAPMVKGAERQAIRFRLGAVLGHPDGAAEEDAGAEEGVEGEDEELS
jgi:hypothetical protein